MQSVVWNEAVKINGADPDFHRRDLWDAIQTRRLPGVGARPAAVRRRVRRQLRLRRARRRPRSSPRKIVPIRTRRPAGARPHASTTSSPRPSRSRSAPRTSCRASTSPTTRCCRAATSPTSTPSSSGSAARTSPTCRSTRRSARSHTSSRTGTWRCVNPAGRVNYEPNSWGGERRPARDRRSAASARFAAEESGDEAARAAGELRRPLQPGAPVLRQPDRRRAEATSPTRFVFELSKVETPAIRDAHGRAPAQRRRGPGADGRRRARPDASCRAAPSRPRDADHGPAAVAGAQHPRERPDDVRRPQARRPGHRRRRRGAARRAAAARSTAEGATLELVAPKIGGVTPSDGTLVAADSRRSTAAPRCCSTRSRCCLGRGRRRAAGHGRRRRRTSSPTPSPTASSSATPPAPRRCCEKAGVPPGTPTRALIALESGRAPVFIEACRKLRIPGSAKPWSSASRKRAGGRLPAQ